MQVKIMEGGSLSCGRKEKREDEGKGLISEDAIMRVMKNRIVGHPLYDVLVQAHLDCLKIGGNVDDTEEKESTGMKQQQQKLPRKLNLGAPRVQAELNQFIKEKESTGMKQQQQKLPSKLNLGAPREQSELNQFMKEYCLALGKLKEAMEEPQQKCMAFITETHLKLKELTAEESAPTSLSCESSK